MQKEDSILIKRLNRGSQAAFSALYDKYVGMVYNYISSILGDSDLSKDITQFCFLQVWEKRSDINPEGNLPAYLYVSARNAVYKEARRQVVSAKYVDFAIRASDKFDFVENRIDINLINKEISKAVESIPESRRKIFLMRTEEDMPVRKIAELLDISPKTVETQISRSIAAIRKHLATIIELSVIMGVAIRFL